MAAPERPIYIKVLKTKGLTADGVFTANAGIVTTALTTSGLLTANAGLAVSGLASLYNLAITNGTTANGPLFAGATGAAAIQCGAAGSTGQVLTSRGSGLTATFQSKTGFGSQVFTDLDTLVTISNAGFVSCGATASLTAGRRYLFLGTATPNGSFVAYFAAQLYDGSNVPIPRTKMTILGNSGAVTSFVLSVVVDSLPNGGPVSWKFLAGSASTATLAAAGGSD